MRSDSVSLRHSGTCSCIVILSADTYLGRMPSWDAFTALCEDIAREARPGAVFVAVHGPPGVGKSTVAHALDAMGCTVVDACGATQRSRARLLEAYGPSTVHTITLMGARGTCLDRMFGRDRQVPAQYVVRCIRDLERAPHPGPIVKTDGKPKSLVISICCEHVANLLK